MANTNTTFLIEQIYTELARFDMTGEAAPGIEAADDLPDGWIRVSENGYNYFGLAADVLARLAAAETPESGCDQFGDHFGLAVFFAAMDVPGPDTVVEKQDADDLGADVWNDYHEFTGLDLGDDLGLIVVRTNAGLKYGFAPDDSDYSAFGSTHDFSAWFGTMAEAISAADAWKYEQAAETAAGELAE